MNHGGARVHAGRKPGPAKVYWAVRMTARQRNWIRSEARRYKMSYGEFLWACAKDYRG
jgi:hypothetical protein